MQGWVDFLFVVWIFVMLAALGVPMAGKKLRRRK